MENKERSRILYVIIVLVIAILILTTDLVLFWISLQDEGVGSGFSRYWN